MGTPKGRRNRIGCTVPSGAAGGSDRRGGVAPVRAPGAAGGELEVFERLRLHGDAVPGGEGRRVAPVHDADGVDEVLVQVVHVLADAILEGGAQRDVVEDREVLDVLAESDAAGVRTDGDAE